MMPSPERMRTLAYPLAVAALAIALYAPTLRYPMQWDDEAMLVDSAPFASMRSAGDLLASPYRAFIDGPGEAQPYRRPANLALLAIERRAFGVEPLGYRVVHAGLHAVCCLLVYALLLELLAAARPPAGRGPDRLAAAFGASLFAVAPYGVDTVLLLTSVGDELVLASCLVALLAGAAFCRGRGAWSAIALLLASAVCVFSKESGAVLPALFAMFAWAVRARMRSRRFVAALGATALAVAGQLAARAAVTHGPSLLAGPNVLARSWSGLGHAVRLALAPHPFGMEVEVAQSLKSADAIAGAAIVALLAAIVWLVRRRRGALFGCAWWLVAFAPSWVAVASTGTLAARYLYFPAVGIAVLAASACAAFRRPALLAVGGAAAAWLVFAALRVFAWSDDFRLWSREAELNPERPSTLRSYALVLKDRGVLDASEALLRRSALLAHGRLEIKNEALARSSLCEVLVLKHEMDAALEECRGAVTAYPGSSDSWLALGNVHAADGAWDKALTAYREAERRDPASCGPLLSIAGAAASLGDRPLALRALERAGAMSAGAPEKLADVERRRALVLRRLEQVEEGSP
jgi:hypothetical protein